MRGLIKCTYENCSFHLFLSLLTSLYNCFLHTIENRVFLRTDFNLTRFLPIIVTKGFIGNYENPESLMQNIILLLTAIVENIPSIADEASVPLVPCLLHYIRKGDVMQHCIRALGSCAVHGGPIFDKHCGQAVTLLLCLNESPNPAEELITEDMNLNMRDIVMHANSALFKIAVYRSHAMQGTGTIMLKNILGQMPIQFDLIEAKIVHKLFINLLERRDLRLLGPTTRLECLPEVCTVVYYGVLCCVALHCSVLYCTTATCTSSYLTSLYHDNLQLSTTITIYSIVTLLHCSLALYHICAGPDVTKLFSGSNIHSKSKVENRRRNKLY